MSKETSESVASIAGRILAGGNPLDNQQVLLVLREELGKVRDIPHCRPQYIGEAMAVLKPYFDNMLTLAASCLAQTEHETISVPTPVNWEYVSNAMVGAIEGGSTYWLNACHSSLDDNSRTLKRAISLNDGIWYAEASYWREGGKALLRYDNPEKGPSQAEREIGKTEIILGLRTMAEKSPQHFADLVNENDDATTHDVFIQYVLFGEIIYG